MFNLINDKSIQQQLLPVLVILLILITLDISTRLTNIEINNNSNWRIEELAQASFIKLAPAEADKIMSGIQAYQTSSGESVNNTMSKEEQLAQKGDLNQLYSDNFRYRLVGVFDKSERFAIIQQFDVSQNEQKLIKVTESEKLKNYKVIAINANKVSIQSNDDRKIDLLLYKKTTKSN